MDCCAVSVFILPSDCMEIVLWTCSRKFNEYTNMNVELTTTNWSEQLEKIARSNESELGKMGISRTIFFFPFNLRSFVCIKRSYFQLVRLLNVLLTAIELLHEYNNWYKLSSASSMKCMELCSFHTFSFAQRRAISARNSGLHSNSTTTAQTSHSIVILQSV